MRWTRSWSVSRKNEALDNAAALDRKAENIRQLAEIRAIELDTAKHLQAAAIAMRATAEEKEVITDLRSAIVDLRVTVADLRKPSDNGGFDSYENMCNYI